MTDHPLYAVWSMMKSRCRNPNHPDWKRYGGRGIAVCAEWEGFQEFFKWAVGSGWKRGLWLDRKNNDKGYRPKNCRWVTPLVSAENRSVTKIHVEEINEIRRLSALGWRQADIAQKLKVCRSGVSNVITGKRKVGEC